MEKLIEILNTDINKKIKSKFLLKFFTEFSVLLDAGLPILYSLDNIRTKNKKERDFVRRIYNRLNEGMSLFTAFSYEDIENKEYILAMLESAELGSPLNEVLSEIKDYLKIKLEKMSKTKSKLIYPIILFVTSILVSFFLILKVLPSFSQMYESMGTDLPTSTKIMISISDFLINNWVYILLAPILLVLLIFIFNRTSKTLRLINHKLIYNFPIYGNIITIRLCYNYSFIIKNLAKRDINILKIIDCLRSLSKNSYLEEKLLNIKDDLTRGESLSKSFEKINFYHQYL